MPNQRVSTSNDHTFDTASRIRMRQRGNMLIYMK